MRLWPAEREGVREADISVSVLRLLLGWGSKSGPMNLVLEFMAEAPAECDGAGALQVELNDMSESFSEHTEPRLQDLLGEPIVHLVMRADSVDERKLRTLLELAAESIRNWRDVPHLAQDPGRDTSTRSADGYRLGVGIMLLNSRGNIFVGQRIDVNEEAWQMPQGGVEEGETPREAALRELQEELGTSKAEIIAETKTWFRYELPTELLEGSRHGQWRGQQQKWFLMLFRGQDSDINVATHAPEFSQWQWVTTDRLIELIVPFKRQLYLRVLQEFTDVSQ